jgi:hypothetical protein
VEALRTPVPAKIGLMRTPLVAAFTLLATVAHAAPPRAEIQVALCEPIATLERKLDLRPRGAPYETWLFDDDALSLLDRGLRLRLRAKAGGSELTLKVARQDCMALPRDAIPKAEGKCEYDVYGDSSDGAVSLTRPLDAAATRELLAGKSNVATLLSDAQLRYLRDVAKSWPLPSDLRPLGPISNRVYTASRYDVDLSALPDGQRHAEISDKVPLERASGERDRLLRYLAQAGVVVCADQGGQAAAKMRRLTGTQDAYLPRR